MRAIDGDRLKRKAQKVATEAWKMKLNATVEMILNEFIDWINEAPTIEPEKPQRTGKWLPEYGDPSARAHYCSACNFYYTTYPEEMNYCPYCGAKMERE